MRASIRFDVEQALSLVLKNKAHGVFGFLCDAWALSNKTPVSRRSSGYDFGLSKIQKIFNTHHVIVSDYMCLVVHIGT